MANKDADSVLVGSLRIREEDGTVTETDAYRALKSAGYADEDRIAVGAAPPKGIDGFAASNVGQGIVTWLVQRNPDGDADLNPVFTKGDGGWAPVEHDARVEIKDVNLWNVSKNGILLAHSSQIDIIDATVHGSGDVAFNDASGALDALFGVAFGATSDAHDVTFSTSSATGFAETGPFEINIGTYTADGIILGGLTDLNGVDIAFTDTLYTPEADFTHALAVAEIPDWVDPADYAPGIDQRRLEDAPETDVTLAELGVDT